MRNHDPSRTDNSQQSLEAFATDESDDTDDQLTNIDDGDSAPGSDAAAGERGREHDRNAPAVPDDGRRLNIDGIKHVHESLWERARRSHVAIDQTAHPGLYILVGPDDIVDNCRIARCDGAADDPKEYDGWCSCPDFADAGVCLHLLVLIKSDQSTESSVSIPSLE